MASSHSRETLNLNVVKLKNLGRDDPPLENEEIEPGDDGEIYTLEKDGRITGYARWGEYFVPANRIIRHGKILKLK